MGAEQSNEFADIDVSTTSLSVEHYRAIQSAIKDLTGLLLKGQSQTDREKIYNMLAGLTGALQVVAVISKD